MILSIISLAAMFLLWIMAIRDSNSFRVMMGPGYNKGDVLSWIDRSSIVVLGPPEHIDKYNALEYPVYLLPRSWRRRMWARFVIFCKPIPEKMEEINEINDWIQKSGVNAGEISDGYHTFNELYEHRFTLFIALCKMIYYHHPDTHFTGQFPIWRSREHSDGSEWPGWFILGIGMAPGHQITYHLPEGKWGLVEFAKTLDRAPEYDGHTANDAILRLQQYFI